MKTERTMHSHWAAASEVGSCNACTDRSSEKVCVVTYRTLETRLCPGCAEKLRVMLAERLTRRFAKTGGV